MEFSPILLRSEVEQAISTYIESRKQAVDDFVRRHYSFEGNLQIHRKSVTWDLIRYPVNAVLLLPLMSAKKVVVWIERLGWEKAEKILPKVPNGFRTSYQTELDRLIRQDLLGIPSLYDSSPHLYLSLLRDQLAPAQAGLAHAALAKLEGAYEQKVGEEVRDYLNDRSATSDLLSSLIPMGVGYWLFSEVMYSAAEIGTRAAQLFARKKAVSDFFLGEGAGQVFYSIFPVGPTATQVQVATMAVVAALAMLSVAINLLVDPLQGMMGVQRRKLLRMLDSLEGKLLLQAARDLRKLEEAKARVVPERIAMKSVEFVAVDIDPALST